MLPTWWLGTRIHKKTPKQHIFTTRSGQSRFHLSRFPWIYVRICSKFQPRNFTHLWNGVRVASMARMLNHDTEKTDNVGGMCSPLLLQSIAAKDRSRAWKYEGNQNDCRNRLNQMPSGTPKCLIWDHVVEISILQHCKQGKAISSSSLHATSEICCS
jgi:hypothetical protein